MRTLHGLVLLLLAACGDGGGGGDPGAVTSPTGGGPDPFDENGLATFELTVDAADWDALVADPFNETWRRCTVSWQGETHLDVALHASGQRSRIPGNPKPSLRLDFDEFAPNREFHGYSGLKLDALTLDPSMMRARIQYGVYNAFGVPAPRYVHCRVQVNGQLKGLYGLEERVSREFVRKRWGQPVNQLYRMSPHQFDLDWRGPDPGLYVPWVWEPRIEELPPDAEGVRDLIDTLNNDLARVPGVFDVPHFLKYIAVETLLGETDSVVAGLEGRVSFNVGLYRSPGDGRYRIIPWDQDQGFWRAETGITAWFENRVLTRSLVLGIPENLAAYRQNLRDLLAGAGATSALQQRIDSIFAQIQTAAFEDPLKPYSNGDVEYTVGLIKSYIEARNAAFSPQLAAP